MRWFDPEDRSEAVITAQRHVKSSHGTSAPPVLPEVCVLFEMGRALDQLRQDYPCEVISEHLPCFLDNPPCLRLRDAPHVCFTKGGYGAPAAVDTLETVLALGVKPDNKLAQTLLSKYAEGVYVVGDCVSTGRLLADANQEAFHAAIRIR